jgi:hypothetical protein
MDYPALALLLDFPEGEWLPEKLRSDFGEKFAPRIVRLLTELQIARAPQGWPIELHVAPGERVGEVRSWLGSKPVTVHAQLAAPSGERLAQVAGEVLARHDRPVILLRPDCPYCSIDAFFAAAWALRDHDVVLGPATDGDFYLLGFRAWPAGLLREIEWGTNQVLFALAHRCRELGLSQQLLEPLERVRDAASWDRAVAHLNPTAAAEGESGEDPPPPG